LTPKTDSWKQTLIDTSRRSDVLKIRLLIIQRLAVIIFLLNILLHTLLPFVDFLIINSKFIGSRMHRIELAPHVAPKKQQHSTPPIF
jgi:hypothetical protein